MLIQPFEKIAQNELRRLGNPESIREVGRDIQNSLREIIHASKLPKTDFPTSESLRAMMEESLNTSNARSYVNNNSIFMENTLKRLENGESIPLNGAASCIDWLGSSFDKLGEINPNDYIDGLEKLKGFKERFVKINPDKSNVDINGIVDKTNNCILSLQNKIQERLPEATGNIQRSINHIDHYLGEIEKGSKPNFSYLSKSPITEVLGHLTKLNSNYRFRARVLGGKAGKEEYDAGGKVFEAIEQKLKEMTENTKNLQQKKDLEKLFDYAQNRKEFFNENAVKDSDVQNTNIPKKLSFNEIKNSRISYERKFWDKEAPDDVKQFLDKYNDNPSIQDVFKNTSVDTRRLVPYIKDLISKEKTGAWEDDFSYAIKSNCKDFLKQEALISKKEEEVLNCIKSNPELTKLFNEHVKHDENGIMYFTRKNPDSTKEFLDFINEARNGEYKGFQKQPRMMFSGLNPNEIPTKLEEFNKLSEKDKKAYIENVLDSRMPKTIKACYLSM